MRKLLILAVVAVVAVTIVPAALAGTGPGAGTGTGVCAGTGTGPGPQAHGARYSLNGTVTAVDADSLTVVVKAGNRAVRKFRGKTVVLTITANTLLYKRNVDGTRVIITLADFAAGDRITSVGRVDRSAPATPVFTAHRVTLRPPLGACANCSN